MAGLITCRYRDGSSIVALRPWASSLVALAGCVWVAFALAQSWGALLDDALIHLRVAENLRVLGTHAYNVGEPGYSTSSPLFTWLLAVLPERTPEAAKLISVVGYIGMILALAICWRGASGIARIIFGATLLCVMSPFGVIWLTDGMETSLAGLLIVLLCMIARGSTSDGWIARSIFGAAMSALLALTRVDALPVIGFVALAQLGRRKPAWPLSIAIGLGAGMSVAILGVVFGHVVPDAAVAKQLGSQSLLSAVGELGRTTIAAGLFGGGLILVWLVAVVECLRSKGSAADRRARLLPSLAMLVPVLAVSFLGQAVHGFRYLVVPTLGAIVSAAIGRKEDRESCSPTLGVPWISSWLVVVSIAAAVFAVDASAARAIVRSRTELASSMESDQLAALSRGTGAAFDVGYVGYFSGARILDLSGLVNGRARARETVAERKKALESARLEFYFLSGPQLRELSRAPAVQNLIPCRTYFLRSRRNETTYTLGVSAATVSKGSIHCDSSPADSE